MTLERRGQWWHGTEAADLDAFLTRHAMQPPDFGLAHRVAHARCAGCGGAVFWLAADEEDNIHRLCRKEDCPLQDEHFICGSEPSFDPDAADDCGCPCGAEHFEVAVGFSHTLVALTERADRKSGKVVPRVGWVYVAARCVACGLLGVYADWHERGGEPPEHLYALV